MRVKIFVLIEKDHKYLLIRESSFLWKGKWFVPGGKTKRNETWEHAVIRETWEEAHCHVTLSDIFHFHYSRNWFQTCLYIFFAGRTNTLSLKTKKDEESLGARWFTYEELTHLPLRKGALKVIDVYRDSKYAHIGNLF